MIFKAGIIIKHMCCLADMQEYSALIDDMFEERDKYINGDYILASKHKTIKRKMVYYISNVIIDIKKINNEEYEIVSMFDKENN